VGKNVVLNTAVYLLVYGTFRRKPICLPVHLYVNFLVDEVSGNYVKTELASLWTTSLPLTGLFASHEFALSTVGANSHQSSFIIHHSSLITSSLIIVGYIQSKNLPLVVIVSTRLATLQGSSSYIPGFVESILK
jgi:hypothetical protein